MARLPKSAMLASGAALALASSLASAVPVLHTTDFINNGSRSNFVDFESLPDSGANAPTYSQDGVNVNQINGEGNDIWSTCAGACWYSNNSVTWYPNGGDFGWTEITRAGGIDFGDVGVDLGSVLFGYNVVAFELLDDGTSVLSGEFTRPTGSDSYIGFSGGGFDRIRLRATANLTGGVFGDGAYQALALDNIELAGTAVPEPTGLSLIALGVLAGGVVRRRKS